MGTLLPIAVGLILVNGLDATAVLIAVGLFYVLSGLYFRVTVPVQPMKVIGAYAIARGMSPVEISSAGMWMAAILLVLGATGAITAVSRLVPRAAVRGVQLTTGVLLLTEGIRFILGRGPLQTRLGSGEPFLAISSVGPLPIGILLGGAAVLAILLLLDNRVAPAGLVVIVAGAAAGLLLGDHPGLSEIRPGLHLPTLLPYGLPGPSEAVLALVALALPQLPQTVGNAVIAQADLTREYFGAETARRSSFRALSISMGLANLGSALIGGMPLCHGAGGLAAHYRFGARTAASNLMIGGALLAAALLVGGGAAAALTVLPFSVLGALLIFAGAQLALTLLDVREREDLFVALVILGAALAANLAVGFAIGLGLAGAFRRGPLRV